MAQRSGIWRQVAASAIALGALALVNGCNNGSSGAETTPTGPPPTVSSGPAPTTAGREYDAAGLDLCGRTDLDPLAGLSLTTRSTDAMPPPSAPGAACLFALRAPGGHEASLRVEASTPASPEDAARLYRATGQVSSMQSAGSIAGLGDEAEAFSKQSEPDGLKYAEYLVHIRQANLVVKVWLAVGGDEFAPKEQLARSATTIARSTLALVPPT